MKKSYKLLMASCGLICALCFVNGCTLFETNPTAGAESLHHELTIMPQRNIGKLKIELKNYYNKNHYKEALNTVGNKAMKCLKTYDFSKSERKPAIVLDIDETSLSNYGYEDYYNFGYSADSWANWLKNGSIKGEPIKICPIQPTLKLYKLAKKLGAAIFFVTGQKKSFREYTIRNLRNAGYDVLGGKYLIMKPNDIHYKSSSAFKSRERKKIERQGYRIIINLGDQWSDLNGGYAEHSFKYPNPFYYIP